MHLCLLILFFLCVCNGVLDVVEERAMRVCFVVKDRKGAKKREAMAIDFDAIFIARKRGGVNANGESPGKLNIPTLLF